MTVRPEGERRDAGHGTEGGEGTDGVAPVVRVHAEGSRTEVRDPRTGVRIGNVGAVLDGRIDEFILAGLQLATPSLPALSTP